MNLYLNYWNIKLRRLFGLDRNDTPTDVLKQAKALISKPERWAKGNSARDKYGRACSTKNPAAASFCVLGAFQRVRLDGYYCDKNKRARKLFREAINKDHPEFDLDIPKFNDAPVTTHKDIMHTFDIAIERSEQLYK